MAVWPSVLFCRFPLLDDADPLSRRVQRPEVPAVKGQAGATAVIEPGGAKKDHDVIARADETNLAMVFTGTRHFNH